LYNIGIATDNEFRRLITLFSLLSQKVIDALILSIVVYIAGLATVHVVIYLNDKNQTLYDNKFGYIAEKNSVFFFSFK